MNRTSSLLLLCPLSLGTLVSTLALNSTLSGANGLKQACRNTDVWTRPQWSPSVVWNCRKIIERLERVEPEALIPNLPFGHEFLPPGQTPEYPASEAVRTPWKLTNGTNSLCPVFDSFSPPSSHGSSSLQPHVKPTKGVGRIGPCTMAITTLAQVPLGYLPLEIGRGPFPDIGYTSWWLIRQYLFDLITGCVDKGEAGISWFGKLKRLLLIPKVYSRIDLYLQSQSQRNTTRGLNLHWVFSFLQPIRQSIG